MSDLFKQDPEGSTPSASPGEPTGTPSSSDTLFADQLKEIVNEQGEQKYDSLPKALDGLKHAQQYIPELKTELQKRDEEIAQLREAVAKSEAVEDVVKRLSSPKDPEPTTPSGLSEDQAAAMFENLLVQREAEAVRAANQARVQESLVAKFGDFAKAKEMVEAKAAELDMTVEDLSAMSQNNPKAVLAMFGGTAPAPSGAPAGSTIKTEGMAPAPEGELRAPEKSLLAGASTAEQVAFLKKVREDVYKKFGVTE